MRMKEKEKKYPLFDNVRYVCGSCMKSNPL